MIYLILAILSSALVSVIMRLSDGKLKSKGFFFVFNYIVCVLISRIFLQGSVLITDGFTLGFGAFSGFLYLASFLLLQGNIKKNGVVLSSVFMKLGVIIPTIVAMLFFSEQPTLLGISGLLIALFAIVLFYLEKDGTKAGAKWLLVVLLLVGGLTDSMLNIFDEVGSVELKDHFLFYNFLFAGVCALIYAVVERKGISKWDILFGCLIGIPNYFSSKLMLLSLDTIPAVVAYPVYSVGALALIALIGAFFFKEKLNEQKTIAIGLVALSLVLLNL